MKTRQDFYDAEIVICLHYRWRVELIDSVWSAELTKLLSLLLLFVNRKSFHVFNCLSTLQKKDRKFTVRDSIELRRDLWHEEK